MQLFYILQLGNYFYIRLLRKRLGCGLWFINKCFCVWWLLLGKGGGERGDDNCYLKCVDCSWWAKKANCYLKSNWNFDFYLACRNKNPWCGILSICQRRRIPKGATGGTEGHERQGEELLSVQPNFSYNPRNTHTCASPMKFSLLYYCKHTGTYRMSVFFRAHSFSAIFTRVSKSWKMQLRKFNAVLQTR